MALETVPLHLGIFLDFEGLQNEKYRMEKRLPCHKTQ